MTFSTLKDGIKEIVYGSQFCNPQQFWSFEVSKQRCLLPLILGHELKYHWFDLWKPQMFEFWSQRTKNSMTDAKFRPLHLVSSRKAAILFFSFERQTFRVFKNSFSTSAESGSWIEIPARPFWALRENVTLNFAVKKKHY